MSNNLIGRFYFKQTSNGNLIGEFSNNLSDGIATESADSIGKTNNYIGDYNSTWQENGKRRFSNLKISQKAGTSNTIFTLEWTDNGRQIFLGEGMLCDNILIGDYRGV